MPPLTSNQSIKIKLHDYSYSCTDGCCTDYGTKVTVNGEELPTTNQDVATILQSVLTHLGYDVEVEETYDYD